MSARNPKNVTISTFSFLTLCACASNFAVYESPTSGRLSTITFDNAADNQKASLATFDDGITCTRRRQIQFDDEDGIPAGRSRSLTVAIGCNAKLSFEVEPDKDYQVVTSEPESSGSCSVVVSEISEDGELVAVETTLRVNRFPRDEPGSFCEPLDTQ